MSHDSVSIESDNKNTSIETSASEKKRKAALLREIGVYLKRTFLIAKPYWTSPEHRNTAWLLSFLIVVCMVSTLTITTKASFVTAELFDALEKRDPELIYSTLGNWLILVAAVVAFVIFQYHVGQKLCIGWREFLTERYINQYLDKKLFNQLELKDYNVDNPDQRIAMDIDHITKGTFGYVLDFVRTLVEGTIFSVILWQVSGSLDLNVFGTEITIPGYMFWIALIYAICITTLIHKLASPLSRLNFEKQRREADFRFHLIRVRENSESIGLLNGEARENKMLRHKFALIRTNFYSLLKYNKRLIGLDYGLNQLSQVVPYLAAIPALLNGSIAMGGFIQLRHAFGNVQYSLNWFAKYYGELAEWKSNIDRLIYFEDALTNAEKEQQNSKITSVEGDNNYSFKNLNIALPNNSGLMTGLNVVFEQGKNTVITGPSGSGKSTLFRVLSGQWIWGSGEVYKPGASILFLPQKPFIPSGTLREALTYPYNEKHLR